MRTLACMCYVWLQGDNIMAMAVHVRTILGCRNFHRLNLADQDGAGRLVSELAAQVYIYRDRVAARWMCAWKHACMERSGFSRSLLLSLIDPIPLGPATERDVAARPAAAARRVVRV